MSWLFGKKKTPKELLRENKRQLDRAIRDIDRERMSLQSQEKKLIVEMKKMAKGNQNDAVKVMAKSLIRMRHNITKYYTVKSQLQAVSMRMQTLKASQAMGDAMKGVTKALTGMNGQLSLPEIQKTLREFERQNEKMDMTEEMMNDAMDDAFEEDGEAEESDELVQQVFDEIGINLNSELANVPTGQVAQPQQQEQQQQPAEPEPIGAGIDEDLQNRLKNLRG
jgi:charged multivesicular body protein 2A